MSFPVLPTQPLFTPVRIPLLGSIHLSQEERDVVAWLQMRAWRNRASMLMTDSYYRGEQILTSMGVSIPKELAGLRTIVGWPAIAIDPIDERLSVEGFRMANATDSDQTLYDMAGQRPGRRAVAGPYRRDVDGPGLPHRRVQPGAGRVADHQRRVPAEHLGPLGRPLPQADRRAADLLAGRAPPGHAVPAGPDHPSGRGRRLPVAGHRPRSAQLRHGARGADGQPAPLEHARRSVGDHPGDHVRHRRRLPHAAAAGRGRR